MTLNYIAKLSLTSPKSSIRTHKVNSSILKTYGIILTSFLVQNSLEKVRFFK